MLPNSGGISVCPGHHDDTKSMKSFTRWESLKVDMDFLAKTALPLSVSTTYHNTVFEEPGPFRLTMSRSLKKFTQHFQLLFIPPTKEYWIEMEKLTPDSPACTSWIT
jgi:hypothetical protein